MFRCLAGFVLGFLLALMGASTVAAADCQFVLGFNTLRNLIGHDIVGECLENEHYNEISDSVQQTTGGLMVWRKADNWTAFTDGYRTWINGPNGLEQRLNMERFPWEPDYEDFAPGPVPTPVATPAPPPVCNPEARGVDAGNWFPFSDSDPLTDDVWSGVALVSSEYDAEWPYDDDDAILVVRCKTFSGIPRLELFIAWDAYVGKNEKRLVALRFDTHEAVSSNWSPSKDGDATFSPSSSEDITRLCTADSLVARVWTWDDETLTAIWDVRGFVGAVQSITTHC